MPSNKNQQLQRIYLVVEMTLYVAIAAASAFFVIL